MPAERSGKLQRAVREPGGYRCRDCGVALDMADGCTGTHRIARPAQGGADDSGNLPTLCFPCHATKGIRAHAALLRTAVPERLPEFVKQMTRDLGQNLLAYSALIDPARFDAARALEEFRLWKLYLDTLAALAGDAHAGRSIQGG